MTQDRNRGVAARLTPGVPHRPRLANGRRRARALFVATLFIFSIFAAQLVRLQAVEASAIAESARDQRMGGKPAILPAVRGQFTDASGVALAEDIENELVILFPDKWSLEYFVQKHPKWQLFTVSPSANPVHTAPGS